MSADAEPSGERAEFMPAPLPLLIGIAVFVPFPLVGVWLACMGVVCFGLFMAALAALMLAYLVLAVLTCIRIDDRGVSHSNWLVGGFSHRWDEVERWSIAKWTADGESVRAVKFKVRGYWWHRWVYDWEAARPGFDVFLEQVRRHAGDKERGRG